MNLPDSNRQVERTAEWAALSRVPLTGFEQGYREGWMSVAGTEPLPENPTQPQPGERRDFDTGFFYGRADALDRFTPDVEPRPLPYRTATLRKGDPSLRP